MDQKHIQIICTHKSSKHHPSTPYPYCKLYFYLKNLNTDYFKYCKEHFLKAGLPLYLEFDNLGKKYLKNPGISEILKKKTEKP